MLWDYFVLNCLFTTNIFQIFVFQLFSDTHLFVANVFITSYSLYFGLVTPTSVRELDSSQ